MVLECAPSASTAINFPPLAFKAAFKPFHHTLEGASTESSGESNKIPQKLNRITKKNKKTNNTEYCR